MFNWIDFLNDYGIRYWTDGKNHHADAVANTTCPFCGDRSNHLNLFGNSVYCWRCSVHKVFETVKELIGCDDKTAELIMKSYKTDDVDTPKKEIIHAERLEMIGSDLNDLHKKYLEGRGFDPDFTAWKFGLKGTFATNDKWAYRIIAPIYYKNRLVSYQGRDFTGKQSLRYVTLEKDKEVIHHKDILYNLDNCTKDRVILVEGVYDAMKLGDNACATFGIGMKDSQIVLLKERFDKVFLMFDPEEDAQKRAEETGKKLKLLGVDVERIVIDEAEDPACLTYEQVNDIKKELKI